ncbi:bifunctional [glutamine synthetase] adenylyltransferase/[glutamine synthetase]-adenylyl-L-tyrosine phosphorylase [Paramagnetospirillum magneticum]|uniref:Bifunctional glutamine synthetase adenylyltransferase/adenylyl-removing enzyme n=1 Tax=Paramagnetospirillum magneticum (strain ATCC 700264 / AMB-1) TaxID=342108 RepID=Q2W3T8_PARM1|nr:bifunctional [glutamine synthetase] adenylyltransferase/[glutamine synthetase]-adenylyl-L-tyrosine phosphorylase [Paramagnetospirillum magneticum]BAE51487.1 Glutamine synthetase adenylyltransferase [Paramagnetospirillum magneticum AMB-1]
MSFPLDQRFFPGVADPARVAVGLARWQEAADAQDDSGLAAFMRALPGQPDIGDLLRGVFANSPFLTLCLEKEPAFLRQMLEVGPDAAFETLIGDLKADLGAETDFNRLMLELRVAKRRCSLLAALADLGGAWPLEKVTGSLATMAEAACRLGLSFLLRREAERGNLTLAHPEDPEKGSGIIVLGMGKLGARELNYSSDIDLIVFYDHEKLVYTGKRSIQECVIALTKELVRILDERTADGYVFRTDLRLRPDPGSTPPAVALVAAEAYYEGFGQNWERAAMIKARLVAGDEETGAAFIRFLRPFIWRKSLDFAAIQDIHSIKRQINAHKGGRSIAVAGHNVKLGRGGIREIEFFAQTQQLIWGGRQPEMRVSGTMAALEALAAAGHVTPQVVEDMEAAYRYLRTLEHRLQMVDDKQTQTLPSNPQLLAEIAAFMGAADLDSFSAELTGHLQKVEHHYAGLFEDAPSLGTHGNLVFTGGENDPETVHTITEMGFANADAVCSTIRGWHHGRVRATRSTRARELLTELTPALLSAMGTTSSPDDAFMRFDEFLTRLPAGVPLFSLFYANPSLLELVAEIMGDAPLLAEHLARHTTTLDSVLQANFFEPLPPQEVLEAELAKALAEADDFQLVLDVTRRWANDRKFQVGVLTLRNVVEAGEAAAALSDVAGAILRQLGPKVEEEFARAHGHIPGGAWVILAMGKAGGREMSATSDLDLILVYDCPEDAEESDGTRPLAPAVWFSRLTQRMVNALTAKTGEGTLYEVDMRLRPSGNSGPIASSLEAFRRYQEEAAWTWEHMALTRARVVAGDPALGARVEAVIRETLTRPRDPAKLLLDVAEMRERMAKEHKAASLWEVKHLRGGLVDIEFTAQYLQLAFGPRHPEMLDSNTARALERAAITGVLDHSDCAILTEALGLWSAVQTVLRQTIAGGFDEATAPRGLKDVLVRAAGMTDFKSLTDRMEDCAASAHEVFLRLVDRPAAEIKNKETAS